MEPFVGSVSPKGQITLPLAIRERLGIHPKDKVVVQLVGDTITVVKLSTLLAESYQAVPALEGSLSWSEITNIAHDEHARTAACEGLPQDEHVPTAR
jgi:AbrB family looped-hinge helix DNA binding protein